MRTPVTTRKLLLLARGERGSELVEFAWAFTIFIMLLFGVIGFGMAMYSYHFVSYAAQEGARYAMVRGGHWSSQCATSAPPGFKLGFGCVATPADVQNYVKSLAPPGIVPANITINTTSSFMWPGTCPGSTCSCSPANSQGCYVKVQVTYLFGFELPYLSLGGLHFTGTSEKVIQM